MKIIRLNTKDNVAVAVNAFAKNDSFILNDQMITVVSDIPAGHKIAIRPIQRGQSVIKYGFPIGWATEDIAVGRHVHFHNLTS
jgi:altronate hydrolase